MKAPRMRMAPEDTPEEDARLEGVGDLKDTEEEEEDEEIVDRERLFDGIAGEELGGGVGAEDVADEESEEQCGGCPHDGGGDGVAVLAGGFARGRQGGQAPA